MGAACVAHRQIDAELDGARRENEVEQRDALAERTLRFLGGG